MGGNKKLYKKLLLKVRAEYAGSDKEIACALEKGEQEEAQRGAHTVKGVAGNLGATELQAKAAELEAAIKNRDIDSYSGLLDSFGKVLADVVEALKAVEPERPEADAGASGEAADSATLIASLESLAPHLKKRKPKPSKEAVEDIHKLVWPEEYDQDVRQLEKMVGKYKFKDAEVVVQSLLEKLRSG